MARLPFQSNRDNELNLEKRFRCDLSRTGAANYLREAITGMVGHERHQDGASHRCPSFVDLFAFTQGTIEIAAVSDVAAET